MPPLDGSRRGAQAMPPEEQVIWHDLECGGYTADLALWRELAGESGRQGAGPILDVGSGTGRVALALAREGHSVVAVDLDAALLAALRERAAGLPVDPVHADARELDLAERNFSLCLVPMLTIQLFGGSAGRARFLSRARSHLAPGGMLACAIVTSFDEFDCWTEDLAPAPETALHEGRTYRSHPRMVRARAQTIVIVRRRETVDPGRSQPDPDVEPVLDVIELDRLDARRLEREGRAAGFEPAGVRGVPATEEHVGHDVVVLRA